MHAIVFLRSVKLMREVVRQVGVEPVGLGTHRYDYLHQLVIHYVVYSLMLHTLITRGGSNTCIISDHF